MYRKTVSLLAVATFLLLSATPSAGRGFDKQRFQEDFLGLLVEMDAVGAAAVVLHDGQSHEYAFGESDRSLSVRQPFLLESFVKAGEASRPVISIAVMQLAEAGKVSLDNDVSEYLGYRLRSPKRPSKTITLRMLLTETKYFEPSEAYRLAAEAVEKVSGERFDRYAKEHIFKPLGIEAYYAVSEVPETLIANSYVWSLENKGYVPNDRAWMESDIYPHNGLIISAKGLSVLIGAVMKYGLCPSGERLYSEASGKELLRQQANRKRQGLAFKYNTSAVPDYVIGNSLGFYRGMSVCIYFNVEDATALIAVCNGARDSQPDSDGVIGNHFNREMRKLYAKHLID
ncbi:MAG: beta-lactamase family protein [Bacteroidales bacterium]|nr:beta-lactamase family protein [Bacteroidales bacterium]